MQEEDAAARPTGPAVTLSGDESLALAEFDDPPSDPTGLLAAWMESARTRVREPLAVVLATADADGRPSTRVVLLKEMDDQGGLVITSHHGSRKGRDLGANPYASVNFYWRETLQQVNVSGPVTRLPDRQADELFAERPLAAQATTAVSTQGAALLDEQELHVRAQSLIDAGNPVSRPAGWGAYRVQPEAIEFWQGRSSRLHRRLGYLRTAQGWQHSRLQP